MTDQNKTVFIIAGEPSGDSRGAELVQALKRENPGLQFEGLGGPKMEAAGAKLLFDLTSISALGLGDVLRQYFRIRKLFYDALRRALEIRPAAIILIDYPGFNLRFAKKIKKKFPVFYYVSPQIWAWGRRRIHTIKRVVNHMIVLFKFEETLYQEAGVPVTWVGHPVLDSVKMKASKPDLKKEFGFEENEKVIALLGGSRKPEVERILPIVLEAASRIQNQIGRASFLLAESPNVPTLTYDRIVKNFESKLRMKRVAGRMHDLLFASDCAIVTSGTATLETAMTLTPFVIIYKAAWSTYWIGRQLIRVPFLGIVNIIAGRKIISEYIQMDAKPEAISSEVCTILKDEYLRARIVRDLEEVKQNLGPAGASLRAARTIQSLI